MTGTTGPTKLTGPIPLLKKNSSGISGSTGHHLKPDSPTKTKPISTSYTGMGAGAKETLLPSKTQYTGMGVGAKESLLPNKTQPSSTRPSGTSSTNSTTNKPSYTTRK